ncbi:MAG: ABC transporter permease [Pseudomonadota bacterium]|nr:peptide ABC transporter permease [Pseudomonadales bacterium]MDY6921939.1 ABC transporter permease [Pseudomonadota bacterium]
MFLKLAWNSLRSRGGTVILTIVSIAISILVLLAVDHTRHEAKRSFNQTVSGVDLIVGARTGEVNLLLYSIFHIGNATNNIDWRSYQQIADDPSVAWTIPIALGDSHRGFRVMGTTPEFFIYFRYGQNQPLAMAQGAPFTDLFDVVLGAQVAHRLQYRLGDPVVIAHGLGATSFSQHDDLPFKVAGILEPTGTPIDQTLLVSLAGIEAIHVGWENGVKVPGNTPPRDTLQTMDLTPQTITAFMVGLQSKMATFRLQRSINQYPREPLMAILPGVTLTQLWSTMAMVENSLQIVAWLVLCSSLLGMCTMLLASLKERQREFAILRSIGAGPGFIWLAIEMEILLMVLLGMAGAVLVLWSGILLLQTPISEHWGLFLSANLIHPHTGLLLAGIIGVALLLGCGPAIQATRLALHGRLA